MIDEDIFNAKEELKRVDHLIFVSLKYTRTCDVMRSIIKRLIDSYDFIFLALLRRKTKEIPKIPAQVCQLVKEHYKDEKFIIDAVDFYLMLRRFNLVKQFTRVQEYRRNVTMILPMDNDVCEITIDSITEYYKESRDFLEKIYEKYYKEDEEMQ